MLPVFKEYLDNFYLAISGIWLLSSGEVRERILRGRKPGLLDSSVPQKQPVAVDVYALSQKLPQAPFSGDSDVNRFIELQGRLVLIGSYDWLKGTIDLSKVGEKDPLIQLFKCLRDAAAHNNHFQIRDDKIKANLPLKWENKQLTNDDDGKVLFSRWMSLGDIGYFLEDVSIPIKKLLS